MRAVEAVCKPLQQLGERCGAQLWAVQQYWLPWQLNPPFTPHPSLALFAARRAWRWGGRAEHGLLFLGHLRRWQS